MRELIGAGIDPVLQAQQQRDAALEQQREAEKAQELAAAERERRLTVRQLFERWAGTELAPHMDDKGKRQLGRKDSGAYVRLQFERRVFDKWGDVPAAEVTKGDWLSVLDQTKSEGKLRTAKMLLADLKQMLNFALNRELVESNPLANVKKRNVGGTDTTRERTLSEDELKELRIPHDDVTTTLRKLEGSWSGLQFAFDCVQLTVFRTQFTMRSAHPGYADWCAVKQTVRTGEKWSSQGS